MKVERISDSEDHITSEAVASSATSLLDAGAVLVVTRSGILRHSLPVAITSVPVTLNQDLKGMLPFPGIDATYVAWAMRAFEQDILHTCTKTGTTVQSIETFKLLAFPVPLPPLPEQHRIVAAIEEQFTRLDAAVASLERARANLKRYRAAVLAAACSGRLVPTEAALARAEGREYESSAESLYRIPNDRGSQNDKRPQPVVCNTCASSHFSTAWVPTTLGALSALVTSGSRGWAAHYSEEGALFIRAHDIKTDSLRLETAAHVDLSGVTEGKRTRVQQCDILVTITGANVTKTALVRQALPESYVSQHVGLIRLFSPSFAPYLHLWIINPAHGRAKLERDAYGAGKPGLNLDSLRDLPVELPPLAEQHRIVAEVERRLSIVDEMEASVAASLARAERLRQAVLRKAFAGELVPQDPTDEPAAVLLERIRAERASTPTYTTRAGRRKTNVKEPQRALF